MLKCNFNLSVNYATIINASENVCIGLIYCKVYFVCIAL